MTDQEAPEKKTRRGTKKYHIHFTIPSKYGEVECVSTVEARGPRAAVKAFKMGPWVLLEEVDKRGRRRVAREGDSRPIRKEQIKIKPGQIPLFAVRRPADYRERGL